MNNEQWEQDFYNEDFFQGNMLHGVTGFAEGTHVIARVRDFIRTQRTAAQRELLEKILREDVLDTSCSCHDCLFVMKIRSRLEARLKALTSNE